jgi:hypothetical protein
VCISFFASFLGRISQRLTRWPPNVQETGRYLHHFRGRDPARTPRERHKTRSGSLSMTGGRYSNDGNAASASRSFCRSQLLSPALRDARQKIDGADYAGSFACSRKALELLRGLSPAATPVPKDAEDRDVFQRIHNVIDALFSLASASPHVDGPIGLRAHESGRRCLSWRDGKRRTTGLRPSPSKLTADAEAIATSTVCSRAHSSRCGHEELAQTHLLRQMTHGFSFLTNCQRRDGHGKARGSSFV